MKRFILTLALSLALMSLVRPQAARAQDAPLRYTNKWTLATDLMQPVLLGGGNLNVTYTFNRMIVDWSHGSYLQIRDYLQTDEQKALDSKIVLPWTTGPGIGYRFTDNLDARVDFKAHRVNAEFFEGSQELNYTEYTIGPGIYYRLYLGKNTGFLLEFSSRYWFDMGNSLGTDEVLISDGEGNQQPFETSISGGFGANIALGYTFGRNK